MLSVKLNQNKRIGVYIHIPFCLRKCLYCDFNSAAGSSPELMHDYVTSLINHMESYKKAAFDYIADSVFIGGGTPTVLPADEMSRLIKALCKAFPLSQSAEFTVEANPSTITLPYLKMLKKHGVNRLSIGMQSAMNNELKALGRIHTRQTFIDAYRTARKAGFRNINIDVMFGIPYQTFDSLMKTLTLVTKMNPEHISLYNLIIEPGTPFGQNAKEIKAVSADEDTEFAMYTEAIEFLKSRGFGQYEISNFSRPGYQCRHNLKYWNCLEYLGFGISAHSYFNNNRFSFTPDIRRYISALKDPSFADDLTDGSEIIEPHEMVGEYVMLRMRLNEGVNCEDFMKRFGVPFEELFLPKIKKYIKNGYIVSDGTSYHFTSMGMFVSNTILSDILDFDNPDAYAGNILN